MPCILRGAAAIAALLAVPCPALAATDIAPFQIAGQETSAGAMQADNVAGAVEVVILFRSDCPPCLHELDILPEIAERAPDLALTLLVLHDDGLLARKAKALHASNLHIHDAEGAEQEVMARYGDDRKALPFSAAINGKGQICARHYGLLGYNTVSQWRESC